MLSLGLVADDRHADRPRDRCWRTVPVGLGVIVHRRRGGLRCRGNHLRCWCVIGGGRRGRVVGRSDLRCVIRRGRRVVATAGCGRCVVSRRRCVVRRYYRTIDNRCCRARNDHRLKLRSQAEQAPTNGNVANRCGWGYRCVNLRLSRLYGEQWCQCDSTDDQQLLEHVDPLLGMDKLFLFR